MGETTMDTLIDFSAAFPSAESVKAAGHKGVMCYVSESRPGSRFGAKPLTKSAVDMYLDAGLTVTALYQFGKTGYAPAPSDWLAGFDGGVRHATEARRILVAAGLPANSIVYAPVDDNPTLDQWNTYIAPFLKGWESVAGHDATGVYCNTWCIDWALEDGVGSKFMQHNWSGGKKDQHPAAHLHQVEIDKRTVGGVGVDLVNICKPDYGFAVRGGAPAPVGNLTALDRVYNALAGS